jgi:hypothetical protein
MQTYNFLAGLPRSGNTVLSSILNQHHEIHSSALSPVCEYLWVLHQSFLTQENVLRNKDMSGSNSIFSNLLKNYYENIDKPIIFDREKAWGNLSNTALIKKYLTPEPKIVYTVRPVIEILASFITMSKNHPWIDTYMQKTGWYYKNYLSPDDNRCDFLMRPWGEIDIGLMSINEIIKPENKNMFYIVEYSDLVSKPQEVMDSIYNFIGVKSFKHNFTNIVKLEEDDETPINMPQDTHVVRPVLKKTSPKPEDVLSDYVINKYSNMEYWRK